MELNIKHKLDNHPDNCKIYTNIKVAKKLIKFLDINWENNFRILEPAVGKSDILINIIKDFLESEFVKKSSIKDIEKKILSTFYAYDVDQTSINYSHKIINELLSKYSINIDLNNNIICSNIFDDRINNLGEFDYIISNPPYISIRGLDEVQKDYMRKNYKTCQNGSFDMYYAFFEKSLSQLNENGRLVFITPNSFLNNKSGVKLREFIVTGYNLNSIYNYPSNHLFSDAQVKTCITIIDCKKSKCKDFKYFEDDNLIYKSKTVNTNNFILTNNNINLTNSVSSTIEDYFTVIGGIATLKDDFFVIKDYEIVKKGRKITTFIKNGKEINIESKIIKKLIKPNKTSKYYIIYPYLNSGEKIPFDKIETDYPLFLSYYLNNNKDGSIYFGKSQSVHLLKEFKLVIPQFWTTDKFILGKNCLVSAGITFIKIDPNASFDSLKKSLSYGIKKNREKFKRNSKNTYTLSTSVVKKMEYFEG